LVENAHQAVVDRQKPRRERITIVGHHRAAAKKTEPVAGDFDHAPAGTAKPRIDADDANRASHAALFIARPAARKPS
jgi:hypothetical protein